jgi:hypothetical protein
VALAGLSSSSKYERKKLWKRYFLARLDVAPTSITSTRRRDEEEEGSVRCSAWREEARDRKSKMSSAGKKSGRARRRLLSLLSAIV